MNKNNKKSILNMLKYISSMLIASCIISFLIWMIISFWLCILHAKLGMYDKLFLYGVCYAASFYMLVVYLQPYSKWIAADNDEINAENEGKAIGNEKQFDDEQK